LRRIATYVITCLLLGISPLGVRPAVAITDQTVTCGTSGSFRVLSNVVTDSNSCVGTAIIPVGVTSIGSYAFSSATGLTSVTLPSTLTSIADNAFRGATSLSSISIPNSVTSIGDIAFYQDSALASVSFQPGSTLTSIGSSAFESATALTAISLPLTLTSLGIGAFREATALSSITIPPLITTIENHTFYGATALTSVTFSTGTRLQTIADNAFSGATSLTSIIIPATVTSIGFDAFLGTDALTSFTYAGVLTSGTLAGTNLETKTQYIMAPAVYGFEMEPGMFAVDAGSGIQVGDVLTITTLARSASDPGGYATTFNGTTVSQVQAHVTAISSPFIFNSLVPLEADPGGGDINLCSDSYSDICNTSERAFIAPNKLVSSVTFESDLVLSFYGILSILDSTRSISASGSVVRSSILTNPTTHAQLVSMVSGVANVATTASSYLPASTFTFATPISDSATVTISPVVTNPASPSATPFLILGSTKIVDIQVSGITGTVTLCIDGSPTDHLYHFIGGAWVELPSRTYVGGQVCGVTSSFSPFVSAPPVPALIAVPVPVPDPVQQSKISGISITSSTSGTPTPIVITGSFIEKIRAIQINGISLPSDSWSQTQSAVTFTMPNRPAGSYQVQIFNGSAPVLASQNFTYIAPKVVELVIPPIAPKQRVTYIRCTKPGHGTRIAYGVNPVCPSGYVKK